MISTPAGVGGAEATLSHLVSWGAKAGREALVLNPFASDPEDQRAREFYAPAAYEGRRGATWRELPALRRWLSDRLERFQPDIVHAHLFHASVLMASIRRPGKARLLLSHQYGDYFQVTGARSRELLERTAIRRFDQVVGCSQSVEDYLLYRYGYPQTRVSHVYNGWSGRPCAPSPDPARNDIVCVARLRIGKNHDTLIDALATVRTHVPDVRLLLAGDGPEHETIEGHVRRSDLAGCVEFLGSVDNVWPVLARSHVFVLPSSYEAFGIAAVEAMAAGLPVVASSVGGLREIVDDGLTGYLVPPRDHRTLATRLTQLLQNREMAVEMGLRGRAAAERYRVEQTVQGYDRVYERLLNEQRDG